MGSAAWHRRQPLGKRQRPLQRPGGTACVLPEELGFWGEIPGGQVRTHAGHIHLQALIKLVTRAVKLEQEGNVRAALKIVDDAAVLAPDSEDAAAGRERAQARIDTAESLAAEAATHMDEGAPGAAEAAAKESLDLLPDQRDAATLHARARAAVSEIFGTIVTRNELAWLAEIRDASGHTDPNLTARTRPAIRAIFGK